jgi:hypothetical protein
VMGWYVLQNARDRRQAPAAAATTAAIPVAPGSPTGSGGTNPVPTASAGAHTAPGGGPASAAAPQPGQVVGAALGAQATGAPADPIGVGAVVLADGADAGAAPTEADAMAAPAEGAATGAEAAAGGPDVVAAGAAVAGTEDEVEVDDDGSEEPEPDVPQKAAAGKLPAGYFLDADAVSCPGGMARIKRKKDVEMADGTSVKAYLVWCIDRHEYPGGGSIPQVDVGLAQAKSLCAGRGRRLCTRAEWRGACGSKYPYGREYDPAACNTVGADFTPRALVAAGSKPGCKSGWGLYDMVGNAAEWTSEGYVNGGSSTKDGESGTCYRSARRTGGGAYVGFRCCADAEPVGRGSR